MSKLLKSVTLAAVAGLWASSALAAPINWADTTTRLIAVLSEDSACEAKLVMSGPPYAFPNNVAATAGCTVYQNSGSAVYNDASTTGPNDFKATLSKVTCAPAPSPPNECAVDDGNWWRMDVSSADEFKVIKRTTDQTAGAVLLTATGNGVLFNIVTGAVKPPLDGTPYYSATLDYGGVLPLDLIGKSVPNDAPFFGTSSDIVTAPTTDGVPLTFSCAASQGLAASNPTLPALGPYWNGGLGTGGAGGADAVCGAGPFPAQPGFNTVSMTGLTAFAASSLEFLGAPANDPATSPAWGGQDWKFEEAVDPDGDGIVSGSTTLGKQFVLDNCPYESNTAQTDSGGIGAAPADMIGNACQCGDTNDSGTVTSSDVTVLKRAIAGLSPYFSVASGLGNAGPGLLKCNVGSTPSPGVGGCTSSDATVISRAVGALGPGIAQNCDAALP